MTTELVVHFFFTFMIFDHFVPFALDKHPVSVPGLGRLAGGFFKQAL